MQQIYNAKSRVREEKYEVVQVMHLYKTEQNSKLHFIREVTLAPEVSVFVSTEQQLIDNERFFYQNVTRLNIWFWLNK